MEEVVKVRPPSFLAGKLVVLLPKFVLDVGNSPLYHLRDHVSFVQFIFPAVGDCRSVDLGKVGIELEMRTVVIFVDGLPVDDLAKQWNRGVAVFTE